MNFVKRGFLGITRKKGKSFILLAVIFILGNLISGAISISQATGNVETSIKERLGAAATIDIDQKKINSLSESELMEVEFEDIDIDLIKEIGELSYVKYYDYNMSTYMGSESIEAYYGEDMGEDSDENIFIGGPSMDFELKGINYAPVLDFEEQKAKLVDGRVFTEDEIADGTSVAIISKKLAENNNLHVGDTFTLDNAIYDYNDEGEEELLASRDVVLEIIGVFESQSIKEDQDDSSDNGMMDFMDFDYQNTIYVSNEIVSTENKYQMEEYMKMDEEYAAMMEGEEQESFDYYEPMFVLNSPEDSEAFEEEVAPLLPDLYTVNSATDQYNDIAGPVESMSKLAKYVLIAAVIATVLITGLVVLLFLRDRKHELGIYLSLGERRGRVVGQILIEVMVVAFIGITLSLFSGNLLAGQVSDAMMKADTNESFDDMMYFNEFQTDLTTEDVLDSYEVSLNSTYILVFYGIGLLTILISTIIPLVYIVRLNPKKILM